MRPYELMVILDAELDEAGVQGQLENVRRHVESRGGRIAKTDRWGRRRFAYEINHKSEGFYVVFELLVEGGVDDLDRSLRLADEVVRHKFIRLPDREAARRGLVETAPAAAETAPAE
jgi:small subunit ribosomal protein S6